MAAIQLETPKFRQAVDTQRSYSLYDSDLLETARENCQHR